jgi:hypothetical protein
MAKSLGCIGEKGYKTDKGNPPKRFYLGFDAKEAEARKLRLEQLWSYVEQREGRWTPFILFLGKAIAKGQYEVVVDEWISALAGENARIKAHALTNLQKDFPIIRMVLNDAAANEERARCAKELEEEAQAYRGTTGQTLYQALDSFREWIKEKYREVGTEKLKPSGKRLMNNVLILKRHQGDMPLSKFGLQAIEDMEDHWQARPKTARGKIAAIETAREQIKLVRKFVNWLNKSEAFNWRRPLDYVVRRMKISPTPEELAARASPEQVKRYKRAELLVLWQYATSLERVLICLGMNCGFGAAEIKSLYLSEIQGNYIKRIRRKTLVYGEWCLWDITVKALDWYKTHRRPKSDEPHLILSRNGFPLVSSENGNNNASISNWWTNLLDRITEDYPTFRRLTFNKLRKTSGNLIRQIADGETMRVFHARGKPVVTDDHSEVYSNRNFSRVFKAIRIMGKKLASVFNSVPDPFPVKQTKPHLTPAKRDRIKELRQQGYTLAKIGEMVGCSDETVRKYLTGG